ncbi:CBS domain-containing protein [Mesobaculum littorinae]|uniref:CBS domain-containing protein n=1 Tax=Mesobaculum littorinae TaxID=2486419 RepID=A0A438ALQ9_9RHOB|nr:CBS domain-containing protein [Mesobaculum littorinae]RVV99476.1 CBS domain-containing protein [Mesobaculum littorinae]
MLVQHILKSKSDDGVVTISSTATVSDAAQILSKRRIGAVVVSEDGESVRGILSERDILRELGRRGPDCLSDTVAQLMTADPRVCAPDDTADTVLTHMTEGRFRHMPVLVDGRMIGLISIGDVVKARLSELSMERDALEGMVMGR